MMELDKGMEHAVYSPTCLMCANLTDPSGRHCRAYQEEPIPWDIWDGKNDHRQPFAGDHGIQFVPHGRGVRTE